MINNISQSVLDSVSSILNKKEVELPEILLEAAKKASAECRNVMTVEDKKNICVKHFNEGMSKCKEECTEKMIVNFERAVEYYKNSN